MIDPFVIHHDAGWHPRLPARTDQALHILVVVKKARDLLFELCRIERLAERSRAREKLPLDLHGQITPTHNHCRPQTMQYVVLFLDRGSALFPVCIETTALPLPSGQGADQWVVFRRSV